MTRSSPLFWILVLAPLWTAPLLFMLPRPDVPPVLLGGLGVALGLAIAVQAARTPRGEAPSWRLVFQGFVAAALVFGGADRLLDYALTRLIG